MYAKSFKQHVGLHDIDVIMVVMIVIYSSEVSFELNSSLVLLS